MIDWKAVITGAVLAAIGITGFSYTCWRLRRWRNNITAGNCPLCGQQTRRKPR